MFETNVIEKIKTHILYSIISPENRDLYEVMWKNMVHPDRPQMTVYGAEKMQWYTHMIYNTYCFFSAELLTRRLRSVPVYVHCLSC